MDGAQLDHSPKGATYTKLVGARTQGTHHSEAAWSPVLLQEMAKVCGQHRFALYNLLEHPGLPRPPSYALVSSSVPSLICNGGCQSCVSILIVGGCALS